MTLYCATGNKGKLREFQLAGQLIGVDVRPLPGLNSITPPEETGLTFEENAQLKATYYSRVAPGPLFADDSGLSVDAMQGAPGIYSARYAGENATDEENNSLVRRNLQGVSNRKAKFICVVALASGGIVEKTFRGEVEGEILEAPQGTAGFGYDPLFYYPPFGCSFGEAEAAKKFEVSHRGKAIRAMMQYLALHVGSF